MSDQESPLSPMQFRFVEEYLRDGKYPKQAAIRAGYSIETASQIASRLLKDPRIQKAIKESQKKGLKTCGITAEMVIQELATIAFAKPGDILQVDSEGEASVNLNDLSKSSAAGSEVMVNMMNSGGRKSRAVTIKTVKPADKLAALTALGKHLGLFKEQVEVTHTNTLKDLIEESFTPVEEIKSETVN